MPLRLSRVATLAITGALLADALVPGIGHVGAQAQAPQFEVASIKPAAGDGASGVFPQMGGRLTAGAATVRMLISVAYDLLDTQLAGEPNWANTDRFNVAARASPETSWDDVKLMLRTLLAQRFRLEVHRERRTGPVFELRMSRDDGRPGPQLRASTVECRPPRVSGGQTAPPLPNAGPVGAAATRTPCPSILGPPGHVSGRQMTMAALATTLSNQMRQVVVDRTGLTGTFDFELGYTPELAVAPSGDATSLYSALREQLGMKLQAGRGPIDVLVVDRLERPTPD